MYLIDKLYYEELSIFRSNFRLVKLTETVLSSDESVEIKRYV